VLLRHGDDIESVWSECYWDCCRVSNHDEINVNLRSMSNIMFSVWTALGSVLKTVTKFSYWSI
jgi:hypothetical protein